MIRTQVYIPDELYAEAKLYAEQKNTSISEFVREGLQLSIHSLKKKQLKKNPLEKIAGKFKFPESDPHAAENHNEIYTL